MRNLTAIFFSFSLFLMCVICLPRQTSHAWYPLNDTGIQFCGEGTSNNDPCTGNELQGQDAHYGRDAAAQAGTLTKTGAGAAGFDYTKISNSGSELPVSATLGSGPNDWACTRDNVTGIMWEVKVDDDSHMRHKDHEYTWYFTDIPDGNPGKQGNSTSCNNTLAEQNCNTENFAARVNAVGLCGFTDWRVPTVKELESIVHHGRTNPTIDTQFFPNTYMHFWSASPVASDLERAWAVNFYYGHSLNWVTRTYLYRVRLARGGQSVGSNANSSHCINNIPPSNPDSMYTIHGDGSTVTDTRTGLIWKRCVEGQTWTGSTCSGAHYPFSWAGALWYAESHVFAGHKDWRLPNVKELRSLVEECRFDPSINDTIFPNTSSWPFWSASPYADFSNNSWSVEFTHGHSANWIRGNDITHVRLVREQSIVPSGQNTLPGMLMLLLDDEGSDPLKPPIGIGIGTE